MRKAAAIALLLLAGCNQNSPQSFNYLDRNWNRISDLGNGSSYYVSPEWPKTRILVMFEDGKANSVMMEAQNPNNGEWVQNGIDCRFNQDGSIYYSTWQRNEPSSVTTVPMVGVPVK